MPDPKVQKFGLSVDEGAAALGISRRQFYNLIKNGQIATFKVGKRRLTRPAAIEACVRRLEQAERAIAAAAT